MRWPRRGNGVNPAGSPGLEFAWRAHQAVQEWTRNVDQKASIVLVFATAIGGVAIRDVVADGGRLADAHGLRLWAVRAMVFLFALSALHALSVVLPQLQRRKTRRAAGDGLIFFGHLRHRTVDDIARELRGLDDDKAIAHLARQLHATSEIAWRKHARLQRAVLSLVLAAAVYASALLS